MKNNITELVFSLDRSCSMAGLESDTIGGFNAMLTKQKKEDGVAYVTTVLFDNRLERLHDRLKIADVPAMTGKDYTPGGCTALLDAIGNTVHHTCGPAFAVHPCPSQIFRQQGVELQPGKPTRTSQPGFRLYLHRIAYL